MTRGLQQKKKRKSGKKKKKHNARTRCTKSFINLYIELKKWKTIDNGGLDEREIYIYTYSARTSKFLATTWRKFPEPISLLFAVTDQWSISLEGDWSNTVIHALKRYSRKESVKGSDGSWFSERIQWCTRNEAPNFEIHPVWC